MKYGCIRFEDPYQHDTGWACRAGEQPFRVNGQVELPSDTVWLTNLDYSLMETSGFSRNARFRMVDFSGEPFWRLPTKGGKETPVVYTHHTMSNLMGCRIEEWSEQTQVLSGVFSRVVHGLKYLVKSNDSAAHSMSLCVRKAMAPTDPIHKKNVVQALEQAVVNFIRCEALDDMYTPGVRGFALSIPKVPHALDILKTPLPCGQWKALDKKQIPGQKEYAQWLDSIEGPFLANITVNAQDAQLGKLLNFGSGKERRAWVTIDELKSLAACCDITVHTGFNCDAAQVPTVISDAVNKIKPTMAISPSIGLMLENIWTGYAAKYAPPPRVLKDKHATNPAAPFVRAVDRLRCLEKARLLSEYDVAVVSYGKGKVSILTDKSDKQIASICRETGLIPPFLDVSAAQDVIDKGALTTPLSVLQTIYIRGERELLRKTDERIFEELIKSDQKQ